MHSALIRFLSSFINNKNKIVSEANVIKGRSDRSPKQERARDKVQEKVQEGQAKKQERQAEVDTTYVQSELFKPSPLRPLNDAHAFLVDRLLV